MGDTSTVGDWADRFAVLGDRSRLTLLLVIRRVGPICVSDLAAQTGLKPTAVSQSLRLLRVYDLIQGRRVGRTTCYELTDNRVNALLDHVVESVPAGPVPR